MKTIKLKFIESGRISDEYMNRIYGGATCAQYSRCDRGDGKANHCGIYEQCSSTTNKKDVCNVSTNGLYQIPQSAMIAGYDGQNSLNNLTISAT